MLDTGQLTAIMRSAAMLQPGRTLSLKREEVLEVCEELLSCRQLLARLGTDLRSVASHGSKPPSR